MIAYTQKESYSAEDLVQIIALLRDKDKGCPWDKVQTHQSIRMNFLEEAYEAVDAIDLADPALLCEELGDVLMQVVFHTCIESEAGNFTWEDVCDGVCRKLIFRHPNIFGAAPGTEGINDWDALKNKEKGRGSLDDDLKSVPHALPALMQAAKLQKRAARYPQVQRPQDSAKTVADAAKELETVAPDSPAAQAAAGQMLFAAVAACRKAKVDPEQALQLQNANFVQQSTQ